MPSIIPAAIVAGGSVLGAGISAFGATSAANAQASAANNAANLDYQRYLQTRADLQPYNTAGQADLPALQNFWQTSQANLAPLQAAAQAAIPQTPTQATIQNMPGYQFNLDQGLKATQKAAAGRGLCISGSALKSASNFSTGLSNGYFQNYFGNSQLQYSDAVQQLQNQQNINQQVFNQLYSPASLGENAAAQTGNIGANLANAQGNALMSAGQATAAGIGASAGAFANSANTIGSLGYLALLNQGNGVLPTGAGTGVYPGSPDSVPLGPTPTA